MKAPVDVAIEDMKSQTPLADFVGWLKNNEEMNYCHRYFEYLSLDDFFDQYPLKSGRKKYMNEEEKSESNSKCECTGKCNDDSCVNVGSSTECDKYNCNVGGNCGNRWSDEASWAMNSCAPQMEEGKGTGLKALECIKKHTCIGPYVGIIRRRDESLKLGEYQAALNSKFLVDAEKKEISPDSSIILMNQIVKWITEECMGKKFCSLFPYARFKRVSFYPFAIVRSTSLMIMIHP